jgi:hypothetical protein
MEHGFAWIVLTQTHRAHAAAALADRAAVQHEIKATREIKAEVIIC